MKHTLKFDGAPHAANGELVNDNKSTAGPGRAQCSCGAQSDVLESRAARKLWFVGHKANPEALPNTGTDPVVDTIVDKLYKDDETEDIIGTPAPKKTRKGSVDIDAEFTGGYAIEFARFVQKLGEAKGLEVTSTRDGARRTVTIAGGTKTMTKLIDDVEVKAMEALHAWQETAPERAEQTAGQRYKGSRAFLADFLTGQL